MSAEDAFAPEPPPVLLVVDDQPANVQALHAVLGGEYRVLMATSGERALQLLERQTPDLVLLDVGMPVMDGHEVLRRIRARSELAELPVIFVTAHDAEEDEAEGLRLGAVDYITKPLKPAVVRARVRTHVELARSRRRQRRLFEAQARLQAEFETARRIQRGLLPDVQRFEDRTPGLELCALLEPSRAVGGDFYDLAEMGSGRLFFAVGDVAGKGIPAALFMAMTKAQLSAGVAAGDGDLGHLLSRMSTELERQNTEQLFVTAFVGVADMQQERLWYCSAGHVVPTLIDARGHVHPLDDAQGPPLCALDGFRYQQRSRPWAAGDALVVVTDGVTEVQDAQGQCLGSQRLMQRLASRGPGLTARQLAQEVRNLVREHGGREEPDDDLTVLCLRRPPTAGA